MNATPRGSSTLSPLYLVVILTLAGCTVGPDVSKLAPARTGQGVNILVVPVETPDGSAYGRIDGELLAVRDDALLLRAGLLALVSYASIERAEVEGFGRLTFGHGRPPTEVQRQELRLLSRYPQGVSGDLLRRLLDAYNQDELRTIP
jgi:hypothetical protein